MFGYSIFGPAIFSWGALFALKTIQPLRQVFCIIMGIASNAVPIAFKVRIIVDSVSITFSSDW